MTINFLQALLVGIWAGSVSGLLGISSGGILVPALAIIFNVEQHLAQMISLASQVLPTAIPGLLLYQKKGYSVSWKTIVIIAVSFTMGGALGAQIATTIPANTLRWFFIVYLVVLVVIMVKKKPTKEDIQPTLFIMNKNHIKSFLVVGFIGGISSGLLGIGGGLAITVLSIGLVHTSQHQAQAISLAVSVLPLTLPAVWVYIKNGETLPWKILVGVVIGLVLGTIAGAVFANRLRPEKLRFWFIALVLMMAIAMAWKLI